MRTVTWPELYKWIRFTKKYGSIGNGEPIKTKCQLKMLFVLISLNVIKDE